MHDAPTSTARPSAPERLAALLDAALARVLSAFAWLALPLALLLCLQWPLRDVVRAYSRDANDLAQWLFALYCAAALTAATRAGTHIGTHMQPGEAARRDRAPKADAALQLPARTRGPALLAAALWAFALLLWLWAPMRASVSGLERFPDTLNFGYFLIKLAAWLLALLVLLQALLDAHARWRRPPAPTRP